MLMYFIVINLLNYFYSVVGTSSLRRGAQLKRAFPHLIIEDVVSFFKIIKTYYNLC